MHTNCDTVYVTKVSLFFLKVQVSRRELSVQLVDFGNVLWSTIAWTHKR